MSIDNAVIQGIQDRLINNWQRVLFRLWVAKFKNEYFFLAYGVMESIIRGGWLPMWALRGKSIGGDAADVRLRLDVRSDKGHGFPITDKVHIWHVNDKKYSIPIYRLDCELTPEDWEEILEKNSKYYYHSRPITRIVPNSDITVKIGKNNQLCFI